MADDEVSLPRATMVKMIKENLGKEIRTATEALDLLIDCSTEFIQLISSEANDIATNDSKNTINPDHVLRAVDALGFSWDDDLRQTLRAWKEEQKEMPSLKKKNAKAKMSGLTQEQQEALQQAMFADARKRSFSLPEPLSAPTAAAAVSAVAAAQAPAPAQAQTGASTQPQTDHTNAHAQGQASDEGMDFS